MRMLQRLQRERRPRAARLALGLALIVVGLGGAWLPASAQGERAGGPVYLADIHGTIDLGLAPYVKRVLRDAADDGAAVVVLDINTPGGRLDAALQIKDALLDSDVPVVAFVNREAFSAGALIAIAADRIYMTPAGVLGAATPVVGDSGETASEKVVSAVRKDFKAVAEARGRDPAVAEAMVDVDVAVEGLVESGKLLTLTAQEAVTWGYTEGLAEDLAAVLALEGLEGAAIVTTAPSWSEGLVRLLTNPAVASLMISLGFLGLFFELTSPGFGVGGFAGLSLLALFFWGHMLAGLTGWEGIALVAVGIGLMALEVFVVPGFGIAGVLGGAAFLAGVFISLIGQGAAVGDLQRAALTLLSSMILAVVGAWALLRYLPRGGLFNGLVLQERLAGFHRAPSPPREDLRRHPSGTPGVDRASLVGAQGVALTDLRPAGTARIEDRRVDVVTEGDYLAVGTAVVVVVDEGYRRVVEAVQGEQRASSEARGDDATAWEESTSGG